MPSCGLVWKQANHWHKLGLRSPRQFLGPYKRLAFHFCAGDFISTHVCTDPTVSNSRPYISRLSLEPGSAVNHDVSPHFFIAFLRLNQSKLKKKKKKTQADIKQEFLVGPCPTWYYWEGGVYKRYSCPSWGQDSFALLLRSCHVIHSEIWMCCCDTIIVFTL